MRIVAGKPEHRTLQEENGILVWWTISDSLDMTAFAFSSVEMESDILRSKRCFGGRSSHSDEPDGKLPCQYLLEHAHVLLFLISASHQVTRYLS